MNEEQGQQVVELFVDTIQGAFAEDIVWDTVNEFNSAKNFLIKLIRNMEPKNFPIKELEED